MKARTSKITALLAAGCMGVGLLAGCGGSGETAATKGETSKDTAEQSTENTAGSNAGDTASDTGAADTGTEAGSEAASEAAAESTGKSITLMASQNWVKDIDRELFKKFQDKTGIEVKLLVTPDNGYDTLLGTSLSGGSNAVDMFMYTAGSTMVSAGIPDVAVDLSSETWSAELEDWALKANSYQDKVIGFSTWGVDYEGILYNKTLFEENKWEIPTTWDGFIALCDQIKEKGVTPLYESINGVWHAQSWVYGLTPAMYEEKPDFPAYLNESADNKFADIACFKKGVEQIEQLISAKDGDQPKYYTNDGQSEDFFGSYPSLQNRETAMMFTYSAYAAELAANGSTDEWGMFPVPLLDNQTGVSNGGGVSKFINKNSDNIDECKMLLNFLAEKDNLEAYYAARTDLVTSAFKNVESVSTTTATTDMLERSKKSPEVMFIKDVLYFDSNVYQYIQGFAEGTCTVDQFIENLDNYRAEMFDVAASEAAQ